MRKTAQQLNEQVATWNRDIPIGTMVEFHPVIGDKHKFRLCKTTSTATVLSGHTAVVFLEKVAGCVALDACNLPVERPAPTPDKVTEFIRLIARMTTEDEMQPDGMSGDDAVETLSNLIVSARQILEAQKCVS